MTEKIGLEAVLQTDAFVAGVKTYDAGIDSMEKSNKDAIKSSGDVTESLADTDKAFEDSGKSAIELASKIDIAKNALAAAQKVIGTGLELAKLGAQAERVEQRFAAFAEEAGGANAILEAFQVGAGGAASKMEAMTTGSRLLQMGLVEDAASMERVVEMATRLGDQTQGVTDRVSDFALMLANQSIPRLDNFGISSGTVRAKIKELQDATADMTREEAFMIAVMEEGGQSLEKLGPRADDSLMAFEKMEAQIADLKIEIGQGLVPAMTAFLGVAADVLGVVSPLIAKFGELAGGTERAAQSIEDATTATRDWSSEAQAMVDGGANMVQVTETLAERVNDATDAFHKDGNVVEDLFTAWARGSKEAEVLGNAALDARKAIIEQASSAEEANRRITQWNETVTSSHAALTTMTAAQFEAAKSMDANREAAAEQEQMWADLEAQADATGRSVQSLGLEMVANQLGIETTTEVIRRGSDVRRQAIDMTAQHAAKLESIRASRDAVAASAQRAADAEQRQADVAFRQAEAMAAAQAASDEFARSQAGLISSLEGATQEMFNQQVLAAIDPADIGLEAYTDLGIELGVLSQEQANLAASIPILTQAYTDGIIPTENMAEATKTLFENASEADFNVGALIDQFTEFPGQIGPSKDELDKLNENLTVTGEETVKAGEGIDGFAATAEDSTGSIQALSTEVDILTQKMIALAQASQIAFASSATAQSAITLGRHTGSAVGPTTGGDIGQGLTGFSAPTSAPATGTFGTVTQSSTTNITEGDTSMSIQVPSMLAAQMLADSMQQSRRARFDA